MYPASFRYHRVTSLQDAVSLLAAVGEDGKLLAGGQSLIPLMKLRLSSPSHLVDINFIPRLNTISRKDGELIIGSTSRQAEIAASDLVSSIPILHSGAAGIADVQVRNRETIGGSVAEAAPGGDWGATLLTLRARVHCLGPAGERSVPVTDFFLDAYTTALSPGEVVRAISIDVPGPKSGGAYIAFKRCASVYASASVAVQLAMHDTKTCRDAKVVLGCVGLTALRAPEAEKELEGKELTEQLIGRAAEAAMQAADPQADMRGSVPYKRMLVGSLTRRAIDIAARRSRGESVKGGHIYA